MLGFLLLLHVPTGVSTFRVGAPTPGADTALASGSATASGFGSSAAAAAAAAASLIHCSSAVAGESLQLLLVDPLLLRVLSLPLRHHQ